MWVCANACVLPSRIWYIQLMQMTSNQPSPLTELCRYCQSLSAAASLHMKGELITHVLSPPLSPKSLFPSWNTACVSPPPPPSLYLHLSTQKRPTPSSLLCSFSCLHPKNKSTPFSYIGTVISALSKRDGGIHQQRCLIYICISNTERRVKPDVLMHILNNWGNKCIPQHILQRERERESWWCNLAALNVALIHRDFTALGQDKKQKGVCLRSTRTHTQPNNPAHTPACHLIESSRMLSGCAVGPQAVNQCITHNSVWGADSWILHQPPAANTTNTEHILHTNLQLQQDTENFIFPQVQSKQK